MGFVTKTGKTLEEAVYAVIQRLKGKINGMGNAISQSLARTTKDHLHDRFPGSTHYSPEKVTEGPRSSTENSAIGEANVDIPGFSRAWHDVTIKPIRTKYLAIPIHQSAYGKSPSEFKDLFIKKDTHALFQKRGEGIVALFALASQAFQKQDSSIAPSDQTYADNIAKSLFNEIDKLEDLGRGI